MTHKIHELDRPFDAHDRAIERSIISMVSRSYKPVRQSEIYNGLGIWKSQAYRISHGSEYLQTYSDGSVWLAGDNSWVDGSEWWHYLDWEVVV